MKGDTTIIDRVKHIMDYYVENNNAFAERIGVDKSNLSKMLNGQRTIGEGTVNKIVLATEFRKDWLLTGEGEMLNNANPEPKYSEADVVYIPLVNQFAYAGYLMAVPEDRFSIFSSANFMKSRRKVSPPTNVSIDMFWISILLQVSRHFFIRSSANSALFQFFRPS